MFKGPADIAVEEVHTILRQIVFRTLESEDCKGLQQYAHLKREIAQTAAATLGGLDPNHPCAPCCNQRQDAGPSLWLGKLFPSITAAALALCLRLPAFMTMCSVGLDAIRCVH